MGYTFLGLLFSGSPSSSFPRYQTGYYEAANNDNLPFASPKSKDNADDYNFDNLEKDDYDFGASLFETRSDDDKLEDYLKKLKAEEQVRTGASFKETSKTNEDKPTLVHKEEGIPVPWHHSEELGGDTLLENPFPENQSDNAGKYSRRLSIDTLISFN